jgi:transposase-like protein
MWAEVRGGADQSPRRIWVGKRQEEAKARFWRGMMREAARSGVSIRELCRRRKLEVAEFYWWRRRLKQRQEAGTTGRPVAAGRASFALVTDAADSTDAGLELVLADGRRLRIHRGADEATLRAVLAALEPPGC